MDVVLGLILWIGAATAAGMIASDKGRSGIGFFFLTLLVPVIGLIVVLVISPIADPGVDQVPAPQAEPEKRCPQCAEMIKAAAVKCRFCGADVSSAPGSVEPLETAIASIEAAGYKVAKQGDVWSIKAANSLNHFAYSDDELRRWAQRAAVQA